MKTFLKFLALFSAAGVPATFATEVAGLSLPPAFSPLHVFALFVGSLVLLTAFSEYSRSARARATIVHVVNDSEKSAHPLAA